MPINSRAKGAKAELEFCELLKSLGYEARRSVQYCGNVDAPDVISPIFDETATFPEVKRVETTQFYPWYEKAKEDAGTRKEPIIFHRKNRSEWMAFLDAKYLIGLIKDAKAYREQQGGLSEPK